MTTAPINFSSTNTNPDLQQSALQSSKDTKDVPKDTARSEVLLLRPSPDRDMATQYSHDRSHYRSQRYEFSNR
jgi:hypothetical protein